ncbi:MAG TPA: transporter [Blastocatellia bacterium]|nr:transporter [Blastocatellia bacterium]
MSRLEFAPNLDQINVTDIKRGLGEFTPRAGRHVSFAALKEALKKAGYRLDSARLSVEGTLARDESGWWLEAEASKQRFAVEASDLLKDVEPGARVEVTGDWRALDESKAESKARREAIRPTELRKLSGAGNTPGELSTGLSGIQVSLSGAAGARGSSPAPVRATSPGLTVYKGGALALRYGYTRQHLGGLKVDRHSIRLAASYTPTPFVQLEIEAPFHRTSFEGANDSGSGAGSGFGNVTLWSKYRFYRALETWGDRQAAVRVGVELPTGRGRAGGLSGLPEFVSRQLGAVSGGLSLHTDVAYSQAKGRVILGGNIEAVLRSERDGFRMGHEVRVNTDLEYVLLPLKYRSPTRELFAILETTYVYHNRGRLRGERVPGSSASGFYAAPALQYTVSPRLALEASYQLPLIHNSGPQVLRTGRSLIVGLKYLY